MEILSDPVQKQKFDAHRRRTSRYPAASGVKGNPWQDAASNFPPPPRRPGPHTRQSNATAGSRTETTSGASRYSGWVPPQPKSTKENVNDNARAWERMRSSTNAKSTTGSSMPYRTSPRRPTTKETESPSASNSGRDTEPPLGSRTTAQKQRAEASFGARRTGFVPASPMGDEPPVSSSNYFTTKMHTNIFEVAAEAVAAKKKAAQASKSPIDPLSQQFSEANIDERQSSPYATRMGEKTNPFDGASLNRARTVRDAFRKFHDSKRAASPTQPARQRSVSVGGDATPPSAKGDEKEDRDSAGSSTVHPDSAARGTGTTYDPDTQSAPRPATFAGPPGSGRAGNHAKSRPDSAESRSHMARGLTKDSLANAEGAGASTSQEKPSVYASPFAIPPSSGSAALRAQGGHPSEQIDGKKPIAPERIAGLFSRHMLSSPLPTPSGEQETVLKGLNAFNKGIHLTLQRLIDEKGRRRERQAERQRVPPSTCDKLKTSTHTNPTEFNSFSFHVPDDSFDRPFADRQHSFMRSSAEDINTRFAKGEGADSYQFNAGGGPSEDDSFGTAKRRHRERVHRGRQSPLRATPSPTKPFPYPTTESETTPKKPVFDAEQWSETIGAENFVPPKVTRTSASPTRRTIKKPKSVKLTSGTAGMVDDEGTSSEEKSTAASSTSNINGAASPIAMDIDTPPPPPPPETPASVGGGAAARNIPVEPSREDWRAGDANGTGSTTLGSGLAEGAKASQPFKVNPSGGSEDSEDFLRPDMFSTTELFTKSASGLGSFGDMKSNLPFQSKAANNAPIEKEKRKSLDFPLPPVPPNPPTALAVPGLKPNATAWAKYVREFGAYMEQWADFNGRVTDHFAARRRQIDESRQLGGFGWLDSKGDSGIDEYLAWLEQDRAVRQKWMAACESHELLLREFKRHRRQMAM